MWGTPTTPHLFGSLEVPEHQKNGEHALSAAKLFSDQINLEYSMRFFPSTLNLGHLAQERSTQLFKKEVKIKKKEL